MGEATEKSGDDQPQFVLTKGKIAARRWVVIVWLAASDLSERCRHLSVSFERLEAEIRAGPPKVASDVNQWIRRMWTDALAILTSYSAITHILWPSPSGWRDDFHKEITLARGKVLRASLGIESNEPAIKRAVRNAFEHSDERLDDWALTQRWQSEVPETMPIAWSFSGKDLSLEPPEHAQRAYRYLNVRTLDVRIGEEWVSLYDMQRFANLVLSRIPPQLHVQWGPAEVEVAPLVPKNEAQSSTLPDFSPLAFALGLGGVRKDSKRT